MLLNDIIANIAWLAPSRNLGLHNQLNHKALTWDFLQSAKDCQNASTCGSYIWKVELFSGSKSKENSETRK